MNYVYDDYYEPFEEADMLEDNYPSKPKWMIWVALIGMSIILGAILLGCDKTHMVTGLFAFFNSALVVVAIYKFTKTRTLCSVIPMMFLLWLIIGWGFGTIYFAVFNPGGSYNWGMRILYRGAHLQMVILVFLIPYLLIMGIIFKKMKPYSHIGKSYAKRFNISVFYLFSFSVIFFVASKIVLTPLASVAGTFLNYTGCLPLILGAQYTMMSKRMKIGIVGLFLFMLFFFALANARRYALIPIISFSVGYFFLSQVKAKTKVCLLTILLIGLPVYMIIGNTVRSLTGEVGYRDLAYKVQVMKEWKYVAGKTDWATSVFGRLFFTGGHAIITMTPSQKPYLGFDGMQYFKEMAVSLVPGKLLEHINIFVSAKYVGNFILNNYGFNLTEEHQAGVTLLGHFWLLGGYSAIVVGGIITAFLQGFVCLFINIATRTKSEKGMFYAAFVLPSMIWMSGKDFITDFRSTFWQVILAMIFYYIFIAPFLKRGSLVPDEYTDEAEYKQYEDMVLDEIEAK